MRRARLALAPLAVLAAFVASGCGTSYPLPTEHRAQRVIPTSGSYQLLDTWPAPNIQDILLTQGTGSQLFFLFNRGGTGGPGTPRGEVKLYSFARPTTIGPPYFDPLASLFNPVAISSGQGKLFVLDQGDTCLAKFDPARATCEADDDTTHNRVTHPSVITDYLSTWRVREFGLSGGDTLSTFTDTTLAIVNGVAADDQGFVYVSGIAAVLDTNTIDQRIRTRTFVSRVYRYARGPRYPGIIPDDHNMPGAAWHRDTTWLVFNGTGSSSVNDPRGLHFSTAGAPNLVIADRGNNQVKTVSTNQLSVGFVNVDGSTTGANFDAPVAVSADLQGFLYIVDRNNRRVLRYDSIGNFVQFVNVDASGNGQALADPVSIGVDDSLAYVADRGSGNVFRFKRNQ